MHSSLLYFRAVDNVWPRECRETFSVDSSPKMNLLNETLLRGGNLDDPYRKRSKSTFFRQFLPASASIKHDLVVTSRTLFELTNRETRLRTLDILWKTVNPGGCLVVVENGTVRGCELILEARHFLLEGVITDERNPAGRIIAPCPHQEICPLLKKREKYRICSDSTRYQPLNSMEIKHDLFSYVVFYKPRHADEKQKKNTKYFCNSWPRIVQPPLKPGKHVIVRVCSPHGNLQELCASKGKTGKHCYKVAKSSSLGDLFPVEVIHPDQTLNLDESLYKLKEKKQEKLKDD